MDIAMGIGKRPRGIGLTMVLGMGNYVSMVPWYVGGIGIL